jgi:hypothetical protein
MPRLTFSFDTVKQIAAQAGLSGKWRHHLDGRWTLALEEDAGLQWSPTRSELSFYGPQEVQAQLRAAVETALRSNLLASSEEASARKGAPEEIVSAQALLQWLVQYMESSNKREYPQPLVAYAKMLVRMFSTMDEKEMPAFQMWSPSSDIGHKFVRLTNTCPTHSYSSMLMDWAGALHDRLAMGDVNLEEAIDYAITSADLHDQFHEVQKGGTTWVKSRPSFEKSFGLRVRVMQ